MLFLRNPLFKFDHPIFSQLQDNNPALTGLVVQDMQYVHQH